MTRAINTDTDRSVTIIKSHHPSSEVDGRHEQAEALAARRKFKNIQAIVGQLYPGPARGRSQSPETSDLYPESKARSGTSAKGRYNDEEYYEDIGDGTYFQIPFRRL
ncbi:hypothetical protein OCU04_008432 [Sclerotinia nivalis]|uniref:Uncharacterized protein n=1 Tax=Sclerotinia nivalis TaxID=352851 RepID=A0A9X0AI15_9HELO|nr:hypothetical protein OCU04_008432 [Sclerotinia nivalis]